MFGKKSNSISNTESNNSSSSGNKMSASGGSHNSIVEGTILNGDVKSQQDFRIDGHFVGTLECDSKVIIGSSGDFDGTINCMNAVIEGQFHGKLNVKEILHVKETANITGDVVTGKLVVNSGSVFDVNCKMTGIKDSSTDDQIETV